MEREGQIDESQPSIIYRRSHPFVSSLLFLILLLPLGFIVYYSCSDAIKTFYASYEVKEIWQEKRNDWQFQSTLQLSRNLQKSFLKFGIYIPLSDVHVIESSEFSEQSNLIDIAKKVCGEGDVYVWIPIRFQLPIVGDKVVEWCVNLQNEPIHQTSEQP